jgi:2,4'-dihydroxyacetophenone dioxygenase
MDSIERDMLRDVSTEVRDLLGQTLRCAPTRSRRRGRACRRREARARDHRVVPTQQRLEETPMAETTEFWRDLKPITTVFKPEAVPEAYISDAPTDDERYYVPLTETVGSRPLFISPTQNRWCDILRSTGAGLVNRHYHPQQVFAYTISGKWGYLEHDWVATAGDFVYEAPGEAHTLVAYESDEPMLVHFNVTGPLIWLDENGEAEGTFDVFDYIQICKEHYEKVGIGAGYVETLFR